MAKQSNPFEDPSFGNDSGEAENPFSDPEFGKPRSAIREIANQGYAGVVSDLPKMAGQAMQYASKPGDLIYGVGKDIADAAEARGQRPDLQPDEENHNIITNTLASGARMIPQSVVPAAVVGAGLAAAPVAVPGSLLLGGSALLGSLPAAMSQGQQTLDKAKAAGVSDDAAIPAARKTALIEGAGETLGTIAGAKLLGLGGKALSTTLNRSLGRAEGTAAGRALEDATGTAVLKPWAKQLPETLATEVGTEMGQNAGEAYVEQQAGIDKQAPWDAAKEAIGPTIGMTALLAPFGLAGHGMQARANGKRAEILTTADADPAQRAQAAMRIQEQIAKVDEQAAENFGLHATQAIEDKAPLEIGEHLFGPPEVESAPLQLGNTEDPLLGMNSQPAVVPRQDGQGATMIDPSVGPLSAAAASAVNSGLTESMGVNKNQLLRSYPTSQAAQEAMDGREDGQLMKIIRHPRATDRFAIVPKPQLPQQVVGENAATDSAPAFAAADGVQEKSQDMQATGPTVPEMFATSEPGISAFDQREADRPRTLDGDIATSATGVPLTNRIMAGAAARSKAVETGQSWQAIELGSKRFVIRPVPQDGGGAAVQQTDPSTSAVDQSAPDAIFNEQNASQVTDPEATQAAREAPQALASDAATTEGMPATGSGAVEAFGLTDEQSSSPPAARDQRAAVDLAAHEAATSPLNDKPEPTDAQREVGNYAKGHISINGLDVSIENPVGSVRTGTDKSGKAWSNTMQHHYGYIRGTVGRDKEHVDAFVKPGTPPDYNGPVFIVDQTDPETENFDEHKIFIGFPNVLAARHAYRKNYASGWKGLKNISQLPFDKFKTWVKDGPKNKPFVADMAWQPKKPSGAPEAPQSQPPADFANEAVRPSVITQDDADTAKRHALTEIDSAIDGMKADAVQRVAARFLPTMGVKVPFGKARIKAALREPSINLLAAAPELGVDLSKSIKAALEAQIEGRLAVTKVRSAEPPKSQEPAKPASKIEDAGQKIGGARKDRWKERGLDLSDLEGMSESEGAELATKANVWKPDYAAMAEATEPVTAAMVKAVYDQLAAKPKKNTPDGRRNYVTMMQAVRQAYLGATTPEEVKAAGDKLKQDIGLYATDPAVKAKAREVLFSVYKGRSDPFVLSYNELAKAKKLVADGFPEKGEPWKKRLSVRAYGGQGMTPAGISVVLKESAELGTPLTTDQIVSGYHRISNKDGQAVGYAASKEDAEAAAKTIYERDLKSGPADKAEPARPHLDILKRDNLPQRIDRDVASDDFVKDFGFRGVEFGNWAAQDERQRILNMAYDGLRDLAEIMGVPPKALSLNGSLGMAFGARGGGRFAAHYEPGKLVINMTKLQGGGSMSHEWAHGLDHYMGELHRPDAYTTAARGASGWYAEEQYKGVPVKRMEQVGKEWKTVEKTRLDNLRPELARAFDQVMSALFSGQETKAQMIRSLELQLERTQALAAKETDPQTKAMYERMVQSQTINLEESRQEPEGKTYPKGRSEYVKQAQKLSGKSANGYWTRPTEMFARAFESWVFDKVTAMGARSDYLVHGVEEDRFAGGQYKGNPYPTGEERATINAALDNLVKTIQTKDTDKGVAMFSSKPFVPASMRSVVKASPQAIQKFADGIAKVAKTVLPINVVANPGVVINAEGVNLASILGVNAADTGGAVVDGQIYLFSDNLRSMGDVKVTLFHELFHFGLRKVIPSADYVALMQELGKSSTIAKMADKWKASAIGKAEQARHPTSVYNAVAIEEALAETEENLLANSNIGTAKPLLIRQLLAWFSKVADRLGFDGMAQAMRRMTMTEAEKFVNQMVRAALGGKENLVTTQDRIADGVFSVSDPQDAASTVNAGLSAATVTDLKHKFGNRLADFRGLALQTLGRRQLVDIYARDIPMLDSYSRMVAQMDADKNEAGADADKLVTDWAKLKDERQLAELMHDATRAQIDPSKPFVEGDDQNFYDALKDGYDRLSPDARAVYARAREMYTEHHEKVRAGIKERIDNSALSSAKRQALLKKMDGELFKKTKGVYFPLSRFGQYLTIVKDEAGEVRNVTRSETLNEAEETRRLLKRTYPVAGGFQVGKVLKAREFNAVRDGVGRGFMEDLFQTLEKTGASEELQESISQLYLASLPDLSWSKHGIHRKGTPGFSQDARRAFAQNMFHGGNYLAKLRFSDRLQSSLDDMQEHVDDQKDNETYDSVKAQQVVDEMVKRHESLMNPKSNPIATALTSFGFVFHLGLSPASALVNLSQTAMVAYPIMGAKWGFEKSATALMKASKETAGNKNDISKVLKGDELEAYNEAVRSGVIDVTMAHDLAGISQGEDANLSAKLRPVMKWASFMFHHAEKFNRQVTFVASYRLAREGGASHDQAYADAVKATYDGHFDYSASNRARVMQGNWPKVILLFKQYAQNMIYVLSRNLQQAIAAEAPQERAQARKAISGLLVSHALGAGVFGLPLVGTLLGVASMIGGDDDEPWDAQVALQNMLADTFGQKAAEVFAHGLSRLTPWDISGRVGLDKLLLPDIQEGLQGADSVNAWMASALGPVAGIAVNAGRGMQDMADGRYLKGLESMMPTALRGPLKAFRYGTEGNVDKTGIVLNDEVGAAGVAGQFLGFSPSETRLAQEGKSAIYAADRAIQARRSDLIRQFAMAAMAGDEEGRDDARKAIERFNEKNPMVRVTPQQLFQSVAARRKRILEAHHGVYLPSKRQGAMEVGRFAAKAEGEAAV